MSSYLVLLDVLDDGRNDISAEKLMKIVQDCQTSDVHDFWSAYFYLHFYTVNTTKLSEKCMGKKQKNVRTDTKIFTKRKNIRN